MSAEDRTLEIKDMLVRELSGVVSEEDKHRIVNRIMYYLYVIQGK
jgi:hypothetical protein